MGGADGPWISSHRRVDLVKDWGHGQMDGRYWRKPAIQTCSFEIVPSNHDASAGCSAAPIKSSRLQGYSRRSAATSSTRLQPSKGSFNNFNTPVAFLGPLLFQSLEKCPISSIHALLIAYLNLVYQVRTTWVSRCKEYQCGLLSRYMTSISVHIARVTRRNFSASRSIEMSF